MRQSAIQTCSFLKLKEGDTALLCMPLQYIGAKMMVVRALTCKLNLIVREPSGHPLKDIDAPLDFAAMIPLQVYNSLQVPEEKKKLIAIKKLIIGGGAIDPVLEKEIRLLPNAVYSTYGMTETLSHIALRRLNGPEASPRYMPFSSVGISLSRDKTLVVNAPLICDNVLTTNDVAEIFPDGSFRILGRKDNIINSGGIKVQTELLEDKIRVVIPDVSFAITSIPDPKFGEVIVLLTEKEIDPKVLQQLPKYEQPKYIRKVNHIPLTGNGKIDRQACKALAIGICS